MLGRGLESLIPNNNNGGAGDKDEFFAPQKPSQPTSVPQGAPQPYQHVAQQHSNFTQNNSHTIPVRVPQQIHEDTRANYEPREKEQRESVFLIEVEKIKANPYQPRHEFEAEALQELAQSIREFGIIQPITVSKVIKEAETGADVEYQLIAGERRLRAAKMAGLERVPAIVKKIDSSRAKLEIALIENIQRSNLNPLESAKAYARLQDEFGLTQREVAVRVGKSRESVANTVRLLSLPTQIQDAISQSRITESQGRALLTMQDPNEQIRMFEELLHKRTSVKDIRERSAPQDDPQQKFWERKLEEKFGAPVKIKKQGGGGTIGIQYYSREELQGILERLIGEGD